MSFKDNPCRKFQANIFNKSKCQNCFKPRESHLLNDEDLNQAKPIYGGWLLLAPEGTNFDNPLHRSRVSPTTLPQGTINMNQCSDVIDGESRTGQKNSLCILTPEKEHFIRAECKEIINGWQEALTVYPRTNKQNHKKKRKVDPQTHQVMTLFTHTALNYSTISSSQSSLDSEPSGPSPSCEGGRESNGSTCGGENRVGRSGNEYAALSDVPRARRLSYREAFRPEKKHQELRARTRSPGREEVARLFGQERRRSQIISRFEEGQQADHMDTSSPSEPSADTTMIQRQGRSERRNLTNKHVCSTFSNYGLKCLYCMWGAANPDLLNFKKGWMTKLYEDGMWKKHWFVLTDQSLKYYRDSIAEEASELDGEIDLSTCYDVKEFSVQRNYGFQILCKEGACTLSAMTSGIRRNWIQAIMKNVRPTIPPDKANVTLEPMTTSEPSPIPDSHRQSTGSSTSVPASEPRKSRVRERRREGRSKTFDWSEFKMDTSHTPNNVTVTMTSTLNFAAPVPPETPECPERGRMEVDHSAAVHPCTDDQKDLGSSGVQEEIEQRWHQVETTPLREEKQVPINTALGTSDRLPAHELAALLDKELGQKQKELERLQKENNVLKEQLENALGREQNAREGYVLQVLHLHPPLRASIEEAVGRMRNELKLEQERSKEQEEEHGRSETTLRAQLKESEDRLREVEASLLERNQALRHLERQQALQRDHMREIQRLQERLQEVTARLNATEEGQVLKEERLKSQQQTLQENHLKEKQNLCKRLTEAETAQKELQNRVVEAEQQVEALLRGKQASGRKECWEEMQKLQGELAQKTDMVESLKENVRRLEEEKGQLTCRCQELLNQIAEADREVNKLRNRLDTEEADYNTLEHSYVRATQEFQKMSLFLREKEEDIRQTKEMYERLVERKEEDLKEALLKLSVLGSSLEETEQKLQAKEELLCQMSQNLLDRVEPCSAEKDLQAKLAAAEDRIAELEQHLSALQLDYADFRLERHQTPEQSIKEGDNSSPDDKESTARRPRIRFSNIQCQKYMNIENMDTSDLRSTVAETKQNINQCVSEGVVLTEGTTVPHSSDPEKFISIIHALESKLLATEDKLRNLTQNLEVQRSAQMEQISKIDLKVTEGKPIANKDSVCSSGLLASSVSKHYTNALLCVENSREKVRIILSGSCDSTDSQLQSLSEVESDLLIASQHIRQGQKTLEELSPIPSETRQAPKEAVHLLAKTLSFEAVVLNKIALLLQTSKPNLLQGLAEIWEEIQKITKSDKDCLAVVYADVLTRKLMLESSLWKDMESAGGGVAKSKEGCVPVDVDVDSAVIFSTFIKAELVYSIQNLKHSYEEKFKMLRRELAEARENLHQREVALKMIIEASKRPDLTNVIKEVKHRFGFGKQKLADIHPPELAPYMEQIEKMEARELAEEIVDRHLSGEMPPFVSDSTESLQDAHGNLANELQRQAIILHKFAEDIESGGDHPELAEMVSLLLRHQTPYNFTSTSLCMQEALIQAQVAYVACRLRVMHEQELSWCKKTGEDMDALVQQHARNIGSIQEKYEASLQEERLNFKQTMGTLQKENQTLKVEIGKRVNQLSQQQEQLALLEKRFQKETGELKLEHEQELRLADKRRASMELALMETTSDSQRKLEVLMVDMDTMEEQHESHLRNLEEQFEQRICELQKIHKEELEKLHSQYIENIQVVREYQQEKRHSRGSPSPHSDEAASPMEAEQQREEKTSQELSEVDSMVVLKDRIQELETQMNSMKDELENKHLEGDVASLREKYQRDFESLKATCERGFAAMEETHQKVIQDLQRQHQREISKLMEERERLLAEETAATIAAIEAMKNAHKEEMEKTHRSQLTGLNSDIDELRLQYEEELRSIQRELEVLSEQYSQKCLENAHLAQALEAERQALRQCQRENQELNAHNQELNNRLTAEISRMRSCFSGETALSPLTQGKDVYELEVLLRIKESEIQYLKQEIHSLKDELQSALRDKKYATDKYKDIYTELSIVKAKADCDISKLKEKLLIATEALDIMKSKSNPDFMKKQSKQSRGVRSKSLKEGLTVQERMKLFEAKDSKKI
uniref:Myosin phosphatase Rho interacting protein n=2 Tax=Eupercaria TaxID=1489922 RepID=A0A674PRA0_TAKRU